MSLENDVKQSLKRHEDDARAREAAWAGIESKIRRAHHQRMVFASALTVALIAATAVLVPKLAPKHESKGPFAHPSVTPTSTPSAAAPAPTATPTPQDVQIPDGWQRRVGSQDGFQVAMPADWKGGWFEGTWDFEPKGLPSDSEGGNTFVVLVTMQPGNYDASPGRGAQATVINGNRALVWHATSTETDYSIEWTFCSGYAPTCSSNFETQTLRVTIRGSTPQLWAKYESTGQRIVETVAAYDGTTPVHGTIAKAVPRDGLTQAMVRFLDARAEGIGADEMMSGQAPTDYNNLGGLYDLNGNTVVGYSIDSGTYPRTSATQTQLGVTIHYAGGTSRTELIDVTQASNDVAPTISAMCTVCGGA